MQVQVQVQVLVHVLEYDVRPNESWKTVLCCDQYQRQVGRRTRYLLALRNLIRLLPYRIAQCTSKKRKSERSTQNKVRAQFSGRKPLWTPWKYGNEFGKVSPSHTQRKDLANYNDTRPTLFANILFSDTDIFPFFLSFWHQRNYRWIFMDIFPLIAKNPY